MENNFKTIAVDFDGALCFSKWPELGEPKQPLIDYLQKWKSQGDKLILWTCRAGDALDAAVAWCQSHQLEFDAVNDNLPEIIEYYGVVNGRFCPQSVRNFCPIVAGFNAGTYKVPACVL